MYTALLLASLLTASPATERTFDKAFDTVRPVITSEFGFRFEPFVTVDRFVAKIDFRSFQDDVSSTFVSSSYNTKAVFFPDAFTTASFTPSFGGYADGSFVAFRDQSFGKLAQTLSGSFTSFDRSFDTKA